MASCGKQDFTSTPCESCGQVSTQDEGMVGCNGCAGWFHYRCVGVTDEVKKQKKWFCPSEACQQLYAKYQKKQEAGRKGATKKTDGSDKSSTTSEQRPNLLSDNKDETIVTRDENQQIRKEKLDVERRQAFEKQDLEIESLAKQYGIETEIRERQIKLEQQMFERALEDKRMHLQKLKAMRESYQSKMDALDKELAEFSLQSQTVLPKGTRGKTSTPLRQLDQQCWKAPGESLKSRNYTKKTTVLDSEPSSTDSSSSSSLSDFTDSSSSCSSTSSKAALQGNQTRPSKAQLTARNGINRRLPPFSGKPEEWPLFLSSYTSSTEACGYNNIENLVRLQESLTGPALENVRGLLLYPKSVPKVIKKLRKLYGRPEILLQHYIDKVRKLESPKAEKLTTYIPFGNAVEQLCSHLEASGLYAHLINPTLIQDLVNKLPAINKREWVRYKRRKSTVNLRTFAKFISKIVSEICETNVDVESVLDSQKPRTKERVVFTHSVEERQTLTAQKPCKACGRTDHRLRFCDEFKKMSEEQRFDLAEKWKLCHICLNEHGRLPCRFHRIKCDVAGCRDRHHTLLHPSTCPTVSLNTHFPDSSSIMFRMIPVSLYFADKVVSTLAFLDEGASVTLIENSLAAKLNLVGESDPLTIKWTADVSRTEKDSIRADVEISSGTNDHRWQLRNVRTVSQLLLPMQVLDTKELKQQYPFLAEVPVQSYQAERPGLLIGLNNLEIIAPLETKVGNIGEPIGVRSKLGWSVYGPVKESPFTTSSGYVGVHVQPTNQEIYNLLKFQYSVEENLSSVSPESKEEQRARKIMEATTVRIGNRFETGLLWRTDDPWFPDGYGMALRRMEELERRLANKPQLFSNVRTQIEQYLQKGYAHIATAEELSVANASKTWYLPLNVVLNRNKPNKVRLVWDAAATVKGISLNSQLMKGPDMTVSLPSVISRFRERRLAFGADIREMYHQIQIRAEDKQVQRFLFREDRSKPPTIYIMDVATFGATCSPCSAQYIKNLNAREYATEYAEAAAAIVENHYVDDYYDSVDTLDQAVGLATQVRDIHARGGFEIRNWVSNSEEMLLNLGEPNEEQAIKFNKCKETDTERVLGIIWNPHDDVFCFSTAHRDEVRQYLSGNSRPTKRIVLSCVMGFFDPLGLLSPFTILGKMLIQDLWRTGCEWDEAIDDNSFDKWKKWTEIMSQVESLRIDRCYLGNLHSKEIESLEMHVFTDASEYAYGCAVYFRVKWANGVKVSLVMSSAKVAPLKRISVPRLELMAAVRGAKLMKTVQQNHRLKVGKCTLWTDSRTVLSWIRSEARNYQQFVSFRIAEVQDLTNTSDWRWVPSKQNIADILTKWGTGSPLDMDGAWYRGPAFLYEPESRWPEQINSPSNTPEEIKPCVLLHHDGAPRLPLIPVTNMSTWNRISRVTATVIRYIDNLKRKKNGEPLFCAKLKESQVLKLQIKCKKVKCPLQSEELQRADSILWKQAQNDGFPDEIRRLSKFTESGRNETRYPLPTSSKLFKLTPIVDEKGVLRVKGRMEKAEHLPFDKRHPIILPRDHIITLRIIQHYHELLGHGNRETVFNEVQQKFYIIGLRGVIRTVAKSCVWCKVHRCVPRAPMMAPLPIQRVTPQLGPFQAVGVDYLGPLEVTVGRRKEKRWVAVFTCVSIRAIHLEVVYTLSTPSCLMAIRRFVCKQGVPSDIFSDNGTNFTGAWNEMQKQIYYECAEAMTTPRTKWHFNPPGTPHMGGIWERMVRSVKEAMKALDDGRKLTDEILWTTLSEVQDMINLRPLTYKSQDVMEDESLTPNHFLRTVKAEEFQPKTETELADALRNIFQRSQFLADRAWQRWLKEYLPSINRRTKWFQEQRNIKKDDLVFVVTGRDRNQWVRGIVDEIFEGRDGKVRQALIRTAKGVNRRSVINLAVLELGIEEKGKTGKSRDLPELRVGGVDAAHSGQMSNQITHTTKAGTERKLLK
ncbi:uncharacterized protein LOC129738342 [Uranotaenia lowii]|uniref:uncharacterized protein LOC129738342 n=1 Tax=Uranotaenia lowii TaxID=190385 RepID=UPI00247ABCE4|nr:uncharacterized protein LOC129738342 [Uranotaenia lowii]